MAGRKLIPQKHERVIIVDRVQGVQSTLNQALGIVSEQVGKLSLKSKAATFDEKESRILLNYVKALSDLQKTEKAIEDSDKELENLKQLSDQELLELAQAQLNKVEKIVK